MGIEKIATCCYCGTKRALVLKGSLTHELACSACGAPLHVMKRLKEEAPAKKYSAKPTELSRRPKPAKKVKSRSKKTRRFLSEVFDVIEDIFD